MDHRSDDQGEMSETKPGLLRSLPRLLGAFAIAVVALGTTAGAVAAFGPTAACTSRSESPAFSRWGDGYNYFLMPNGNFESGTTNWALSNGAYITGANESYYVGSTADHQSLALPYNSTAESRTICVSRGEDTIRMFVYNPRVAGSILHVQAIVRNPTTGQTAETAFDVNGDSAPAGWAPTMRLAIANLLGGTGTEELTIVFTTRGSAARWVIDDVYVDPYKSF